MEKFFKQDKRVFLFFAALVSILFLVAIFGERIAQIWRLANYKHPTQLEGFKIGDSKSDLIFFGNGNVTKNGKHVWIGNSRFSISDAGTVSALHHQTQGRVEFFDGRFFFYADSIDGTYGFPVETAQNLIVKFGQPHVYSESSDSQAREYTYLDDSLKMGTTYFFKRNRLQNVTIREVQLSNLVSLDVKIFSVDGVNYCPGEYCPFAEEGLKPGWKNKTVRDLVEAYK